MYEVYDISEFSSQRPELLGTKEKRWVVPPNGHPLPARPHLFKIGREGTGENWAERVAQEICLRMGLPAADYQFATDGNIKGVITREFFPEGGRLIPANMLLSRIVDGYDVTKKFLQRDYTLIMTVSVVERLTRLRTPVGYEDISMGMAAKDIFIGYLVLDALIGNTDRHHENWGVVISSEGDETRFHLSPTFDHASSLGRNEQDAKRQLRLTTRDQRASVEAYAQKARCAFFGIQNPAVTLTTREMMTELAAAYPEATRLWARRAISIPKDFFTSIFEQISPEWISVEAVEFAIRLLMANQRMISETALG